MIACDSNRSNDVASPEFALEELRKRIEAWIEESRNIMENFNARPDRVSRATRNDLRETAHSLRTSKTDFEISLDSLALDELREARNELRRLIRAALQAFENWYWDFLWKHRGSPS